MISLKRYRISKYNAAGEVIGGRQYARTISEATRAAKHALDRLLAIERVEIERRYDSPLELSWKPEETITR
jgi:hypothetical protein